MADASPDVSRPPVPLSRPSTLWLVLLSLVAVAGLGALGAAYVVELPLLAQRAASGVVSAVIAVALAWRTGGRPWISGLLVVAMSVAVLLLDRPFLYAGATVGTAVMAAVLALMVTTPAARYLRAAVEVVIALVVATLSGLAAAGWQAEIDHGRYDYVVLGGSLLAAGMLVYRLGAGFHGLGRRGYIVIATALAVIVIALVYGEALTRWGPTGFLQTMETARADVQGLIGAVPHPIESLVGVPAIVYGVFVRARRRQGWWVVAFGAAVTAPSTERFMEHGLDVVPIVLGAAYSLVIGLAIGYLVIRVEQAFTGSKGSRARRREEAEAVRPEPSRTYPLS